MVNPVKARPTSPSPPERASTFAKKTKIIATSDARSTVITNWQTYIKDSNYNISNDLTNKSIKTGLIYL